MAAGIKLRLLALLLLAVSAAGPAGAATGSLNLGLGSDYVFRGLSRTDGQMRAFGAADLTAGPFYAGAWLTTVDLRDGTDAEWGARAGLRQALGVAVIDAGLVRYGYAGAPGGTGYDHWEVKASGSAAMGSAVAGAAVFYSPDGFGALDETVYVEASAAYLATDRLSVGGAVGRRAAEGRGDYTTWNLGATWALAPRLTLDLRYHDTDRDDLGQPSGARVVATVKASFP